MHISYVSSFRGLGPTLKDDRIVVSDEMFHALVVYFASRAAGSAISVEHRGTQAQALRGDAIQFRADCRPHITVAR